MKRGVNFAELIWTMLLFVLITDFTWGFLPVVVFSCPIWIGFYDKAKVNRASKTAKENREFNKILDE